MKTNKLVVILSVFSGALILTFLIAYSFIGNRKIDQIKIQVAETIDPKFPELDKQYFNPDALNPTKLITIDGSLTNPQVFNP